MPIRKRFMNTVAVENPTIAELRNAYISALWAAREAGEMNEASLQLEMMKLMGEAIDLYSSELAVVLTPEERKRMIGANVINHGFIQASYEKAMEMPELLPAWLGLDKFESDLRVFEARLVLYDQTQRMNNMAFDALIAASDAVYHDALVFYRAVKDAVAAKVPGAEVILEALSTFFKSRGNHKQDKPIQEPVEQDLRTMNFRASDVVDNNIE